MQNAAFEQTLLAWRERIQTQLAQTLQAHSEDCLPLSDAMRYGTLAGGKRLRAILVYASAEALTLNPKVADSIAVAIELIHAYSLIHDDLPAMDDDALRRGKPTCHIQFDEATAILAGDALQALAFEVLAQAPVSPVVLPALIARLAQDAGRFGMVGGQQLDLVAENQPTDLSQLERIHRLKTGALIRACCALPAIAAAAEPHTKAALDNYAQNLGLAFQVHDDVLDITADTATLGKTQGADMARGKATYPSLMGLQASQAHAIKLHDQAIKALDALAEKGQTLVAIANYMLARTH